MLFKNSGQKANFIAEVSSNHHRDLDRCLRFVDVAAKIGCCAVKFQLFKVEALFHKDVLANSQNHRDRENWELPVDFLEPLATRCKEKNILFGCTPFYLAAVPELLPHVDFFKIASYELLWDDLIKACAETGKPLILSTGMADMEEVEHAVSVAQRAGVVDLTILHCVSSYPAQPSDCNLKAISTIRKTVHYPVGWSDHTTDPAVILRAIYKWGAELIEFHLDLDEFGEEFASGHCWLPENAKALIDMARIDPGVDGTGSKKPQKSEEVERLWRADPLDGLRPLISTRATLDWS
jgi:sialic acid synthase SpsE